MTFAMGGAPAPGIAVSLCPALYDPMNYSPPGSSVLGTSWAFILEWVAIPFSRGSSWPRDRTEASCIGRRILDFRMNISSSQNTVCLLGFHVMMASMEIPCHFRDPVSPSCLLPYPISLGLPRAFHLVSVHTHTHTHMCQATSIQDTPQFKGKDHKHPNPQLQRIHQSWTFSYSGIGEGYKWFFQIH